MFMFIYLIVYVLHMQLYFHVCMDYYEYQYTLPQVLVYLPNTIPYG